MFWKINILSVLIPNNLNNEILNQEYSFFGKHLCSYTENSQGSFCLICVGFLLDVSVPFCRRRVFSCMTIGAVYNDRRGNLSLK